MYIIFLFEKKKYLTRGVWKQVEKAYVYNPMQPDWLILNKILNRNLSFLIKDVPFSSLQQMIVYGVIF